MASKIAAHAADLARGRSSSRDDDMAHARKALDWEGMYRAVNVPDGTAYKTTRLAHPGDYVLLGKTGSAETRKEVPTHSWFIGYLAPSSRYKEPVQPGPASVAIAEVVEYGGHGGAVAAPIAAKMLDGYLLELARATGNAEQPVSSEGAARGTAKQETAKQDGTNATQDGTGGDR